MQYTFGWTISEIVNVTLVFEAVDERGAVSELSVQVQICACENDGACTLDGLEGSTDSTVVLNCNCTEGKIQIVIAVTFVCMCITVTVRVCARFLVYSI